jgi:hypothetical protein
MHRLAGVAFDRGVDFRTEQQDSPCLPDAIRPH